MEVPTNAFPKFRLLALHESKYDCVGGDVPVPETGIVCVLPAFRLVLTTMFPLKVSAASGWNMTWKDALA